MRQKFLTHSFVCAALAMFCPAALAEHSDVTFLYQAGKVLIEPGPEGLVFEGEFPTSGFFEQFTTNPGFASETLDGLGIGPNDQIDYEVLGPLVFHDGAGFASVPAGAMLSIADNPFGSLTVDDSTLGPVSGPGLIGSADGTGDFHSHISFTLQPLSLDAPAFGAYGLLMRLTTDHFGVSTSDPFFIVSNFGLDEAPFGAAVEDFAGLLAVPEPSTFGLMGIAIGLLCLVVWLRRPARFAAG